MEKETLALAFTCMSMFATEHNVDNDSKNDNTMRNLQKLTKDITDRFPSISMPVSELYKQEEIQKGHNQSEEI
jgi:hypothetical protein